MAKFKKYSKSFLCILSAGVFFIMALFYPLEDFMANESLSVYSSGSTSVTINQSIKFSLLDDVSNGGYNSNTMVAPVVSSDGGSGGYTYTSFYYYVGLTSIVAGDANVYAYRFWVKPTTTTRTLSQVVEDRVAIGSFSDFANVYPLSYGVAPVSGTSSYIWYVNDYSTDPVYFGVMLSCYGIGIDTESWSPPSYTLNSTFTIYYDAYTMDDLMDELYTVLTNIYSTDTQMLSYLKSIYTSVDTVETKLSSLITIGNSLVSNTDELEELLSDIDMNTDELEALLDTCNSCLDNILTELEEQTTWLEKIYNALIEFLGLEGEETMEEMPDDDMSDMTVMEDELLGNASADDLSDNLSVSIDSDSSAFIWDIINSLVTANSTVFGGFISVLSLGIVALILGR